MDSVYLYSVLSMGGIAAFLAAGLGFASKFFQVEKDDRIKEVEEVLPSANCGACGYAGCSNFAEAVVKGEASLDGCPVGGDEVADKIAEILDLDSSGTLKQVAQLLCNGGRKRTKKRSQYQGIETCAAVDIINGGPKSCQYGCFGYGDCAEICPFDAIVMDENELPVIDKDKCTGCGKCVDICPQNVLTLAPYTANTHIMCSSHDSGKVVKKICEIGCIGCGLCAKTCPVDAITMEDNLAVIDYDKCINCGLCAEKCPTNTIIYEGQKVKEIKITDKCVGCTKCAQECPVDAIEGELKQQHYIDPEVCIKCGVCAEVCQVEGAIEARL